MKNFIPYYLLFLMAGIFIPVSAQNESVMSAQTSESLLMTEAITSEMIDSLAINSIVLPDPAAVFDSLPQPEVNYNIVNLSLIPKVFVGYRKIHGVPEYSKRDFKNALKGFSIINGNDSLIKDLEKDSISLVEIDQILIETPVINENEGTKNSLPSILQYERPFWFENALRTRSSQEDLLYSSMIDNPLSIDYAYWDLPTPPVLLVEDRSYLAFINKQEVVEASENDALIPEVIIKKKYWLHTVNAMLQFSQAYVSANWYQGGNSYLSMLFGFNWKVNLNQVYHPNILFQSNLSYKLAFTSNPKGSYHKYNISEDNFQYNLNTGLKAAKDWYYSLNLQFKTQLFNNFDQSSNVRTASFLSPGDLNLGLGMSYNHANKLKTFQFTLIISPLSYNLKTCISDKVDHLTYNIPVDKKTKSEIGSNIEFNMEWMITSNISYKTKLFTFTDYHYFLGDWQNTFNFEINKFLSTQIFVNLRYDGSSESYGKWKKFMMKEILSFGLSYNFSTKP